jgi:hypothetical protein
MADVANTPEHTDEQADHSSLSPVEVKKDYQLLVTFKVQSRGNYNDSDLVNNEVTCRPGTERREYVKSFKGKLSQRRLVTDIDAMAVGALGFCVPLSNESPS